MTRSLPYRIDSKLSGKGLVCEQKVSCRICCFVGSCPGKQELDTAESIGDRAQPPRNPWGGGNDAIAWVMKQLVYQYKIILWFFNTYPLKVPV